jgi:M6 family metalloprotease-like protein
MSRTLPRSLLVLFCIPCGLLAADPVREIGKPSLPDLSEFRTVDKAITTRISKASPTAAVGQAGFLGIHVQPDAGGKLIVAEVAPDSPAARAQLRKGDILLGIEGHRPAGPDAVREWLQARAPGETVKLALLRHDQPLEVTATLAAVSRPMSANTSRATIGVRLGDVKEGGGAAVARVLPGSPADKAGLKEGEVILRVDGKPLTDQAQFSDALLEKRPDDTIVLTLRWERKEVDLKVKVEEEPTRNGRSMGWDNRVPGYWNKRVYRLAVVPVEYPDVKHNPKITAKDWEDALFSRNTYTKKSVTGQTVHGSLNDYYQEQSYGKLRVEGKVFDWVQVGKKRADYGQGTSFTSKAALLTEAVDKLQARDGKEALKDYDGIFFVYAGDRVQTNRGGLYWPHRASFTHQGKRWSYFICPEGGERMNSISVICHEFGHMLGLPDLYARPEQPGSEGLGVWCAMSNQAGNGRPQHFSAWPKEKLGWLEPAVLDPTVKQKLILGAVEDSPKECVKILVKPDGSEYLLLENRRKKGFDASLPAEGLLIWRVVNNRPILEESHGVEGPAGPRVHLDHVPYPSTANNAFTPYTTPSSRSQLGGGLPVHVTNIRRLPDGRVTFYVGYEFE